MVRDDNETIGPIFTILFLMKIKQRPNQVVLKHRRWWPSLLQSAMSLWPIGYQKPIMAVATFLKLLVEHFSDARIDRSYFQSTCDFNFHCTHLGTSVAKVYAGWVALTGVRHAECFVWWESCINQCYIQAMTQIWKPTATVSTRVYARVWYQHLKRLQIYEASKQPLSTPSRVNEGAPSVYVTPSYLNISQIYISIHGI